MDSNMTQDYLIIATENMTSFKEQIVTLAKSYTMYKIGKLQTSYVFNTNGCILDCIQKVNIRCYWSLKLH